MHYTITLIAFNFLRHVDYIHYNPIKHDLCERAVDWPYTTFHRQVRDGVYMIDWDGMGWDGMENDITAEGYGE